MKYKFTWTELAVYSTEIEASNEDSARVKFWNRRFDDEPRIEKQNRAKLEKVEEVGCSECHDKTKRLLRSKDKYTCIECLENKHNYRGLPVKENQG